MNDQQHQDFGTRDSSGHWKPPNPAGFSPLFERPWSLLKVVRWLFQWGGYIFPMYVFYATLAWLSYSYLQPSMDTFNQLEFRWMMLILIRNLGLTILVYGSYHLILYRWRLHGSKPAVGSSSSAARSGTTYSTPVFTVFLSGRPTRLSTSDWLPAVGCLC